MTIAEAIERYIEHKRSLGMKFVSPASVLHSFARAVGNTGADEIDGEQVRSFLFGRNVAAQTASGRCYSLRGFYRYALARGIVLSSPLPVTMPRISQRLVPHVYTDAELTRLFRGVGLLPRSKLQPHTMQALLLVLYGAGLRIGEAVRLVMSDVDLANQVLSIRQSKFYKDRLVPVGRDLTLVLQRYAATRRCLGHTEDDGAPFFVSDEGGAITIQLAEQGFRRLCRIARIHRKEGGRHQPRLHDLRHSFAVHRLVSWYKAGADVNLMLPRLSTYLGHFQMSHTQRYLTMTPELLQQASARFEALVQPEVIHD